MSVFAEYGKASVTYDDGRYPNGADLYLGLVYSLTSKTKESLHLLDIGCGTGNHVKYLLDRGLQRATMFDANPGMLEKARLKLKEYIEDGKVTIEQHSLPEIPYKDGSFDVVMCNQVLQHVTSLEDKEFNSVRQVVKEAYRVLKPNGVLLIQICTPYQCYNGYWFLKLYPIECTDRFAVRNLEPKKFLSMLRDVGFTDEGFVIKPLDLTHTAERYFREDGPLHPEWRNSDSVSSTLHPDELDQIITKVQAMKDEGKLSEFMREADSMREHVGQFAVFYAKKNSS